MAPGSVVADESSASKPLAGENILLPADHYDSQAQRVLESTAVQLGATITPELEHCTIMVVNEHSPRWADEQERIKNSKPTYQIRPYHWLTLCGRAKRRLESSELDNKSPFMVSNLFDRYPVKVWVSVNVSRNADETAEEAQTSTISDLENAGAIIVPKRAHADVLIVDIQSNFYATVKKEKEAQGRTWQKLAQRDWVDYCIRTRSLTLHTPAEDEEVSSAGEDSFREEPVVPVRTGAGPGRPTGKPRIEYTGQDDDFLCRWLAAFYPEGSWTSRKTFALLAMDNDKYPMVDRHSSQSWQERFKKNSASFSRRVRRFVAEDIDPSLKTRPERLKDREKRAQEAGLETERPEPLVELPPEVTSSRQDRHDPPQEAASTGDDVVSAAGADTAQTRDAVPNETVDTTRADVQSATSVGGPSRRLVDEEPESDATTDMVFTETVRVLIPETTPTAVRVEDGAHQGGDPSSLNTQSISSIAANEPSQDRASITSQEINVNIETIETSMSATMSVPAERHNTQLAGSSVNRSVNSTVDPNLIQVRPASELLGQPSNRPEAFATPSPKRSPKKRRKSELPAGSTPLRQEILRSQEKRQRMVEREAQAGPSHPRALSPDKVYAYVGVPPRTARQSTVTTPDPPARPTRTPSPELTPIERHEKVLKGSRIVNDIAAQYRAKVGVLTRKYGIGPKEIAIATKEMRETKKADGSSGLDWDKLDSFLARKYGH